MGKRNEKPVQKISVKIWEPIINQLSTKIEAACLRRDPYLAKVLESELIYLDNEVSIPNSPAAYDYVRGQLETLKRKPMSLSLPPDLTQRLNEICNRKRIVRDAFFNRLFLLLAASPKVIDWLLFRDAGTRWRSDVWSENKHDGPFFQNGFYPLESTIDPFWAVRCGIEMSALENSSFKDWVEPTSGKTIRIVRGVSGEPEPLESLYTVVFNEKAGADSLLGFSCHMPDWLIPGTEAEKTHTAKLEDLFDLGD